LHSIVKGELTTMNSKQLKLSCYEIEFNETDIGVPMTVTVDSSPTIHNMQVIQSGSVNGVNFYIDWYFDTGLEMLFSKFIVDFSISIGRYPSYEMTATEGLIKAKVTSISIDLDINSVTTSASGTTTTTTIVASVQVKMVSWHLIWL